MFLAVFDCNVLELCVLFLFRRSEDQRRVGCRILRLVLADGWRKRSDVASVRDSGPPPILKATCGWFNTYLRSHLDQESAPGSCRVLLMFLMLTRITNNGLPVMNTRQLQLCGKNNAQGQRLGMLCASQASLAKPNQSEELHSPCHWLLAVSRRSS